MESFTKGFATLRINGSTSAVYLRDEESCFVTEYQDVGDLLNSDIELSNLVFELNRRGKSTGYSMYDFAPLIKTPSKIIGLGLNYLDHIAEMGRTAGGFPTLFAKFADSLTGPYSDIALPEVSGEVDYEAEMAIIVGKVGKDVPVKDALGMVGGFCCSNDVSMRDFQWRTSQFLQGKIFDASTPLGPVLVQGSDVDYGGDLAIRSLVNGVERQSSRTSMMIFSPADIIAYISQIITLRPGDVILTGTPGGVGAGLDPPTFLKGGDAVKCEIEGLGSINNIFKLKIA